MRAFSDKILLWLNNALSISDEPRPSDLVFVLAGRQVRKAYGLQLFRQSLTPRLLLSVARFDVRKLASLPLPEPVDLLALAKPLPVQERYFFLTFAERTYQVEKIRKQLGGTLSEIIALRTWLKQRPEITSVQIVSSGFHLRRVRLCSNALLAKEMKKSYVAVPEDSEPITLFQDRRLRKALISEIVKLLIYRPLLRFRLWQLSRS